MVSNPRYPITIVLKDHGADIDLKPYLEGIRYEETGNREVSSAIIKLNAHFGRFMKNNVIVGGTTFPHIDFFDRIYFRFTDPDGNFVEDVVEVLKKKPAEEKGGVGDILELHCDHQGFHFFRMHNLKQYQRESGFEVIKDCGQVYTSPDVIGTKQPILEKHDTVYDPGTELGVAASQATAIDFDFGNKEFRIGDALNEVADRLGTSVSAGGELEFFDWRTISKYNHATDADIDKIQLQFRVSGDVASQVTISKDDDTVAKILDTRGELEPEKSTNVFAYGDINSGSTPPGFMIYFGEKEWFNSAKDWTDGRVYKTNMRVQYQGAFYISLQNHTASLGVNDPINGIGTFWNVETFTPNSLYSQWTKNKPQYWITAGAGYVHQQVHPQNNKAACYDQNLVVRDDNHRRSWVDVTVDNDIDEIPTDMYLTGGGAEMYRTFRVLVKTSTLTGTLAQNGGKDRFNKSYSEAVVKHNGGTFTGSDEYKNWDVFLESEDDLEIVDCREGESWVYNPCSNLTLSGTCSGSRTAGWQKGAYQTVQVVPGTTVAQFLAGAIVDCLHPYNIISGTPNVPDFGNAAGVEPGTPGQNSAIRIKYEFADGVRSLGAWANLAFPIPRSGFGGAFTSTTVGEMYQNPKFDLNNMHLSSKAKRGLNQGIDKSDAQNYGRGVLDYGKVSATRVYIKLIPTAIAGLKPPAGDFKIRCAFFDDNDNVIVADKTVTHRDNFDELTFSVGEMDIYRARPGIAFTLVKELEIVNIFEKRNIVRVAFSTLDSYDAEGRYNPLNRFAAFFGATEINLDGFHFVTPLTATTQEETVQGSKPDRNLERDPLDRPQISNYVQLKNDIDSMLEIERFRRVEYSVRRPLRCNVKFGQEFILKHPRIVEDDVSPTDEVPLVCKKNIYEYTKGKGRGGYTVTHIGAKRFRQ